MCVCESVVGRNNPKVGTLWKFEKLKIASDAPIDCTDLSFYGCP